MYVCKFKSDCYHLWVYAKDFEMARMKLLSESFSLKNPALKAEVTVTQVKSKYNVNE